MPKCYWSLATLYKMEGLFSICNTQLLIKTSIVIKKIFLHRCCNYLLLSRMLLCKYHVPHVSLYVSERWQ